MEIFFSTCDRRIRASNVLDKDAGSERVNRGGEGPSYFRFLSSAEKKMSKDFRRSSAAINFHRLISIFAEEIQLRNSTEWCELCLDESKW